MFICYLLIVQCLADDVILSYHISLRMPLYSLYSLAPAKTSG